MEKRVLVVDDEAWVADLVATALQQCGYVVQTTSDGESALRMVDDFEPQLVVLDVMLPGENGYRVSRQLKTGDEGAPPKVLLLTGRRLDQDPEREQLFMDFSMADSLLYKPFEIDQLRARVFDLLGEPDESAVRS